MNHTEILKGLMYGSLIGLAIGLMLVGLLRQYRDQKRRRRIMRRLKGTRPERLALRAAVFEKKAS